MTRDEAIEKVKVALHPAGGVMFVPPGENVMDAMAYVTRRATEAVDIAVALGLKLDEPRTVEQKASDALIGFQVDVTCPPRTCLTLDGCEDIVRHLQNCGFKIVRSD